MSVAAKDKPSPRQKPAGKPAADAGEKSTSGNGSGDRKATDKPEGKLLPWEPVHPPAEVKPDKAAEPPKPPSDKPTSE
jgi:hypothetical protein